MKKRIFSLFCGIAMAVSCFTSTGFADSETISDSYEEIKSERAVLENLGEGLYSFTGSEITGTNNTILNVYPNINVPQGESASDTAYSIYGFDMNVTKTDVTKNYFRLRYKEGGTKDINIPLLSVGEHKLDVLFDVNNKKGELYIDGAWYAETALNQGETLNVLHLYNERSAGSAQGGFTGTYRCRNIKYNSTKKLSDIINNFSNNGVIQPKTASVKYSEINSTNQRTWLVPALSGNRMILFSGDYNNVGFFHAQTNVRSSAATKLQFIPRDGANTDRLVSGDFTKNIVKDREYRIDVVIDNVNRKMYYYIDGTKADEKALLAAASRIKQIDLYVDSTTTLSNSFFTVYDKTKTIEDVKAVIDEEIFDEKFEQAANTVTVSTKADGFTAPTPQWNNTGSISYDAETDTVTSIYGTDNTKIKTNAILPATSEVLGKGDKTIYAYTHFTTYFKANYPITEEYNCDINYYGGGESRYSNSNFYKWCNEADKEYRMDLIVDMSNMLVNLYIDGKEAGNPLQLTEDYRGNPLTFNFRIMSKNEKDSAIYLRGTTETLYKKGYKTFAEIESDMKQAVYDEQNPVQVETLSLYANGKDLYEENVIPEAGTVVSAKATVKNLNEDSERAVIWVAGYKDGELVSVNYVSGNVLRGSNEIAANITIEAGTNKIKAGVWGADNLKPYDSITFPAEIAQVMNIKNNADSIVTIVHDDGLLPTVSYLDEQLKKNN